MFRGSPGVAVPTVLPRLPVPLFTLLRLGFQTIVCCVLRMWFDGGRVRSLSQALTFSRAELPELRGELSYPHAMYKNLWTMPV